MNYLHKMYLYLKV